MERSFYNARYRNYHNHDNFKHVAFNIYPFEPSALDILVALLCKNRN
jgi:hypothetical protein